MRGELRHRPAVDVAAGLLVLLAAVEAWFALDAVDAQPPYVLTDPLASIVAALAALVTALVLVVGARRPGLRERSLPVVATLVVVAALGWGVSCLWRAVTIEPADAVLGGVAPWRLAVPALGAAAVTAAFAVAVAVWLRSDRRAVEMATGAVVTLGASELAALCLAPGSWLEIAPSLYLQDVTGEVSAWIAVEALTVPAAAIVVLRWLASPRAGRPRIAARCRGACAAVAATLLVEAFVSASGPPSALPRVLALAAGAVCAGFAAYRWNLARTLAPIAALAGASALTEHAWGEDAMRLTYFPEPAYWVPVGLLPAVVALVVLWAWYRPAPVPLEPAGVPAVPHPPPTPLTAAAVATPEPAGATAPVLTDVGDPAAPAAPTPPTA
jgi:hypothetical protein